MYGLALGVVVVFALGTRADDDDRHLGCGMRCSHDQVAFRVKGAPYLSLWNEVGE